MTNVILENKIVKRMKEGRKLLTIELDFDVLAELGATAKIFGARSNTTFIHQYIVQKIREAKQVSTPEEFNQLVEEQKAQILERSKRKTLERKKSLNKLSPMRETAASGELSKKRNQKKKVG